MFVIVLMMPIMMMMRMMMSNMMIKMMMASMIMTRLIRMIKIVLVQIISSFMIIIILNIMIMIGRFRGVCDHQGELLLSTKENEHYTFQPRLFCKGDEYDFDRVYDD